jgi:hypothetical protein
MNVRDVLILCLAPLGVDIRVQGSISESEPIPETMITYEIIDSIDHGFYDNQPTRLTTRIQLMIYSTKMSIIKSLPDTITQLIKEGGFVRESRGHDQGFFGQHYGWLMEIHTTERMFNHAQ